MVHFRYLHYLLLLFKETFLSSTESDFIILRTFMLYSEFSAYLNWQIQYQSLTMMSQRNFLFRCCQFFFFLSIIGKKKKKVIMPKCHRLWQNICPLQKSSNSYNFYKALSALLGRVRISSVSYMVNIQGGISFLIVNNPMNPLHYFPLFRDSNLISKNQKENKPRQRQR